MNLRMLQVEGYISTSNKCRAGDVICVNLINENIYDIFEIRRKQFIWR